MVSPQVLEAWIRQVDENANTRLDAHAEDITDHARCIDKLESWMKQYARIEDARLTAYEELAARADKLQVEQADNDRTFREVISDKAELARRIDELAKRVKQLERLLERED